MRVQSPPPLLLNWRAEFRDPQTEKSFREWSYKETAREASMAILMASSLFLIYAVTDYARHGPSRAFYLTFWLRVLGLLIGLATVAIIRRRRETFVLDFGVVAFELSVSALFGAVLAILEPAPTFAALGQVIVILGAYLFIPNRFPLTAFVGWSITIGFLAVSLLALEPNMDEVIHVVAVLTFASLFGTGYSHRLQTLRRREYAKLMTERQARKEIQAEVERRKQLEQRLLQLATTDPLTGAFNRRYFMDAAEREIKRIRRNGRPLSVLLIDIDHFKNINDTYGHAVGDDLLRELSHSCRANLRSNDVLGRLGGEEFAVLAPEIGQAGAFAIAERLRQALELPIPGSSARMSVSIGVAEHSPADPTIAETLRRADAALYMAKRAGRNRVMSSELPPPIGSSGSS